MTLDLDALDFAKGGGTITVVTVDDTSGRVLMVAHADRAALEASMTSGEMHYRSRTRGMWRKGATSGNVQRLVSLAKDCDGDAVLARVRPAGPACHAGTVSCFPDDATGMLSRLDATIDARANCHPEQSEGSAPPDVQIPRNTRDDTSYTAKLLADSNLRLKKIGEEAAELVHAAALGDKRRSVEEAADLFYHTLVVLRSLGAGVDDVSAVLSERSRSTT
jgi:phosphoribosyl-AMP cyclohydrolase / phosphoribosyl-ATP pyrophosphohydrolase